MTEKLVSIDLYADFGFLRKPDNNDGLQLSYNMLHKPALIGILGAIVGLKGYGHDKSEDKPFKKGDFPEYYDKLKHLLVGIAPLEKFHDKGNFAKTSLKYNNGVGYASGEAGGIWNITESMLIRPAYRCFILLDVENDIEQQLYDNLMRGYAEFIPYLGKNEFQAYWKCFKEYAFETDVKTEFIDIKTLFLKAGQMMKGKVQKPNPRVRNYQARFMYFERLPVGFDEQLFQYEMGEFVFTDFTLSNDSEMSNLYFLSDEKYHIQLI